MQPKRFADALLEWICADGQVRARTFADAGYTGAPFGVELWLPTGAVVYLQTVGAGPPGNGRADADAPVYGGELPLREPVALPTEGPTELAAVERWLAWRITTGRSAEIASVGLFQSRNGRASIPHGLAVAFHSGAKAWVYLRHATPAGRQPAAGPLWRALPTV
ncbi:hypothetical protein AB0M39_35110 [Streptomyces sp. NPDC051907]|uniref:hypothetical protein n=1 Tax=Streptomyces sp. NPDC051907 TaxID=3155284 RepID=UPI0034414321